jgi:hypothetical protein
VAASSAPWPRRSLGPTRGPWDSAHLLLGRADRRRLQRHDHGHGPELREAITDFELGPINALQKGKVYERLLLTNPGSPNACGWFWQYPQVTQNHRVKITVNTDKWGWQTVPTPAKTATLLQTAGSPPAATARSASPARRRRAPRSALLATLDPDLKTSLKRSGGTGGRHEPQDVMDEAATVLARSPGYA